MYFVLSAFLCRLLRRVASLKKPLCFCHMCEERGRQPEETSSPRGQPQTLAELATMALSLGTRVAKLFEVPVSYEVDASGTLQSLDPKQQRAASIKAILCWYEGTVMGFDDIKGVGCLFDDSDEIWLQARRRTCRIEGRSRFWHCISGDRQNLVTRGNPPCLYTRLKTHKGARGREVPACTHFPERRGSAAGRWAP